MADTREYKYKLSLEGIITEKASTDPKLEIFDSKTSTTIGSGAFDICLNGLKFFRKIYEPGLIEAEVSISTISNKDTLPSMDDVKKLFIKRKTELTITPTDTNVAETLAENYFVYMVNPVLTKNNAASEYYVKLTIYSMDKLMAINKYSKAYVSKKLATDILKTESKAFGLEEAQVVAEVKNLRNLTYKNNEQVDSEKIQPYLVQYNESFYDFMVRTANRCGEFLYFDDGKLTIGLPSSTQATKIGGYDSVTMQDFSSSPLDITAYARDGVKDDETIQGFNADAIAKDNEYPKDAFPENTSYNAELAHDDHIFPMKKDNFTDFTNDLGISTQSLVMGALESITTNTDGYTGIPEMIRSFGADLGAASLSAYTSSAETNAEGNDDFVDIFDGNSPQTDGSTTVQFGTVLKSGWPTLDFYNKVHKHEEEQKQKMVCIDMGVNYVSVKLGDKITIDGMAGNYIVTQVTMHSAKEWNFDYKKFQQDDQNDPYEGIQSQQIWVIPTYFENNVETAIPPVLDVPVVRKSGPQTAFVVDNSDPKHQGRVRIAYPWQSVGEKSGEWTSKLKKVATPWIRVVTPMATDGGGAYFKPNKGDEVLVNYDNDNIERPYVVGCVYSKNLNEPNCSHDGGSITMQTPNGQFITLSTAKGSKFVENLAPILKQATSLFPSAMKELLGKIDKNIGGGITMSDAYGMFKIDMSTHNRSIDISSPYGNVGINAFTGITINAPNGDVKICGKNVSIEAGNNLSIKSGGNVDYDDFSLADTIKGMIKDTVKDAAKAGFDYFGQKNLMGLKLIDCAMIRCVMDTFLKPVEGTLCIKSNNYLKLEAGKGKAEVPIDRYSNRWQDYKKAEGDGEKQLVFSKMAAFAKRIDGSLSRFCNEYKEAKEKAYQKKATYDWLVAHLVKEDKVSSLQDIRKEAYNLGTGEFKKHTVNKSVTPATITYGLVKMDGFKQENLQEKKWPGYWVSGVTFLKKAEDIQAHILDVAEEYAEAVYKLHRMVLAADNIISDQSVKAINQSVVGSEDKTDTSWMDPIFLDEAKAVIRDMIADWKARYGDGNVTDKFLNDEDKETDEDPFTAPKLYKRVAMAKILYKLYNAEENKIKLNAAGTAAAVAVAGAAAAVPTPGKYFKLDLPLTTTINSFNKDYVKENWKQIASLGGKKPSTAWKVFTFLLEFMGIDKQWKPVFDPKAPLKGWAQKVWNDQSGQIIFSNKKGATYALNGEQIEKYEFTKERNLDSLKKTLLEFGHEE